MANGATRFLKIVAIVVAIDMLIAAVVIGAFIVMPGKSFEGMPAALSAEEAWMAQRMRADVMAFASTEHNTATAIRLDDAATYIEAALRSAGHAVRQQPYIARGHQVRNLEVSLSNVPPGAKADRIYIVGAHYDSARGTAGANDNGSGTAVLLELARQLKGFVPPAGTELKLVFFTNEEPPYFQREGMGSRHHAKDLRDRGEHVEAVLILETLGYYSDQKGSQKYPVAALKALYPDAGNFVAIIGTLDSVGLVRDTTRAFRERAAIASEGLAAPAFVRGVTWSDHSSYVEQGYKAVMITDTAVMRYPHYHTAQDTPDKLNYDQMARLTSALVPLVKAVVLDTP